MKIAILTNFQDWNPGYSLTGIVKDQCIMLKKFGHEVHVFTCESYNPSYGEPEATIHSVIPFGHLIDYTTIKDLSADHTLLAEATADVIEKEFSEIGIDFAFTHDLIFTGWNLPYALSIKKVTRRIPELCWLHWIHSVPSGNRDWWKIGDYGPQHRIAFPNKTDKRKVAEQFQGLEEAVRVVPHIKDLRTWYDFSEETIAFLKDYPKVMQSDFVQIYPASTDRLSAKRVDIVLQIFSQLKARGFSVCLVIANQWATGKARREDIKVYDEYAKALHLELGDEFIFTSEWKGKEDYTTGIPHRMLRELQLCSNLFIFPTREESFGLVGPEAALGGAFMVLNKNLMMMSEVFGNNGIYFDFGSYDHEQKYENVKKFYYDLGTIIIGRCWQDESFRTRTWCRQMYNYDWLYINVYEPIFGEAKLWIKDSLGR